MRYSRLSFLLSILLLGSIATGQASYSTFGSGCGSASAGCPSANATQTHSNLTQNTNIFALGVPASTSVQIVFGFELFTRAIASSVTINTQIYYADAAGAPTGSPVATGTMKIDAAPAWYKTIFATPLIVPANQKYFLSYTSTTQMYFPFAAAGTYESHFWHPATATTWNGTPPNGFLTQRWMWRVNCAGGSSPLTLSNTGVPTIGGSFSVDMTNAPANAPAIFAIGLSNTTWNSNNLPLDLSPVGASGCAIHVSLNLLFGVQADAGGSYSFKIPVPNDPGLKGLKFYNQYAAADVSANALGVVFSNGGAGVGG